MRAAFRNILALALASAVPAASQCASHHPPALFPVDGGASLGLSWRETALAASGGLLSEAEASARFHPARAWEVAMRWPFAVLDLPTGTAAGLGDPAFETGYRMAAGAWTFGAAGQLSAPLGHAGDGLGSDAFGAALWLSAAFSRPAWAAGILSGMRGMRGGGSGAHDHSAGTPEGDYALAHPHSEREWAYRAEYSRTWGRLGALAAVNGAHVLKAGMGAAGSDFVDGEAALRFTHGSTAWKASARVPLAPDRRLDFGFEAGAERAW